MSEQNIVYLALMIVLVAASVILILTEHYGWAWIPFFLAAYVCFSVNEGNTQEQEPPGKPLVYVAAGGTYPPCKGANCGHTDGFTHSPECRAEHAAVVNAAARIERLEETLGYLLINESDGTPRLNSRCRQLVLTVLG